MADTKPNLLFLMTDRWKYVCDPEDVAELYDLENDPLEMHNLASAPEYETLTRDLHAQCKAWHTSHGDTISFDRNPG